MFRFTKDEGAGRCIEIHVRDPDHRVVLEILLLDKVSNAVEELR